MKFTLDWLKDHLETSASLDEIVYALTDIGLEVEGIDDPAAKYAAFTIAHVKDAVKHPDADKLRVCTVETKDGVKQIVCGAPNARAGMTAVYAPVGAYVPGIDVTLSKAKIRGVESLGMLVSERELELSDEHDGIMDLEGDYEVGAPVAGILGLTDPTIEIAITPDRADCLGVRGIARDLAAKGLGTLKPLTVPSITEDGDSGRAIVIEDEDACPYFAGRLVRGVKNGASPDWMHKRLTAIGVKPISALVDVTNYIAFDHGRPLHVYDAAKLKGDILARMGQKGEEFLALNEKTYQVDDSMIVIADDSGVLGLGGIIGGEETGVSETTTDVFIESALFERVRIGKTGRGLAIDSDARYRFERDVDPTFVNAGLDLATDYITQFCGGTPAKAISAGTVPVRGKKITFDPAYVKKLTGLEVSDEEAFALLEKLGFDVSGNGVTVPSWRADIDGKADLVEEVMRLKGLDEVPTVPLPRATGVAKQTLSADQLRAKHVRRSLAAAGLNEAVIYAFIAEQDAAAFAPNRKLLTLANPISSEMTTMRPSLLPGLLRAAKRNLDRGQSSVRLFELGRVFDGDGADDQPVHLAFVLAGDAVASSWQSPARAFSAYDAKALALQALNAAKAPAQKLQTYGAINDALPLSSYHPGQAGELRLGPKNTLARFGMLHPAMAKHFDISGPVAMGEVLLEALPKPKAAATRTRSAVNMAALQPVGRDFAFVIKTSTPAENLLKAIKGADKKHITDVSVFDVYSGTGLAEDEVSLALRVTLQPIENSFIDKDLETISNSIIAAAEKAVGARLRA